MKYKLFSVIRRYSPLSAVLVRILTYRLFQLHWTAWRRWRLPKLPHWSIYTLQVFQVYQRPIHYKWGMAGNGKVNSVQEACAKGFVVHKLEFVILQTKWKNKKRLQNIKSIDQKLKTKSLMFFVLFFHVICKISNVNMWTAKHLVQASCTELTLPNKLFGPSVFDFWGLNQFFSQLRDI